MKKYFVMLSCIAVMAIAFFTLSSFEMPDALNDSSCTVTVKYGNGDPAKNVEVMPMNYSSLLGWVAADCGKFTTNSSGVVKIKWYAETIKALYIKGNRYEMTLSDGGSYTVTLKQRWEND